MALDLLPGRESFLLAAWVLAMYALLLQPGGVGGTGPARLPGGWPELVQTRRRVAGVRGPAAALEREVQEAALREWAPGHELKGFEHEWCAGDKVPRAFPGRASGGPLLGDGEAEPVCACVRYCAPLTLPNVLAALVTAPDVCVAKEACAEGDSVFTVADVDAPVASGFRVLHNSRVRGEEVDGVVGWRYELPWVVGWARPLLDAHLQGTLEWQDWLLLQAMRASPREGEALL